MLGAVLSIGTMMTATGSAGFLADVVLGSGILSFDFLLLLIVSSILIYAFHTVCPIGIAAMGLFLPIFIGICASYGVSPVIPAVILAFIVAGNFILPINPVLSITYNEGYYSFRDAFVTGIIPATIMMLVLSLWVPFMVGLLNIP
jgi:sodium-dependent dicarboxylate transporter 2/3/5